MNLNDTVKLMSSEDYKERFIAEYLQTKLRYDRLHRMVTCYEAGTLEFKPKCPIGLLKNQEWAMGRYLKCLEVRAQIEQIPLDLAIAAHEEHAASAEKIINSSVKEKADKCSELCKNYGDCAGCPCYGLPAYERGVCGGFNDLSEEELDECLARFENVESKDIDAVHPQHYKLPNGMQVIDIEVALFGKEAVMHHCFCTAAEYILRHMQKNGVEDIKKAHWWLEKYIELEASK